MNCDGCQLNAVNLSSQLGDTEEDYVLFLQRHGVLRREMLCPDCGQQCKLSFGPALFRCQKVRYVDRDKVVCKFIRSVKTNTWLSKTNLTYGKVIKFISVWLTVPHPRNDFIKQSLGMSNKTVVDWSNVCREICIDSLVLSDVDIVGGQGMTVEVNKAKLGKQKNDVVREGEDSWIFGAFERCTNRCFFEMVQDLSAASLMEIIVRRIAPGTTIVSDMWRNYDQLLNQQQHEQLTVDHDVKFVHPSNGSTQNFKKMWKEVRSNIPKNGKNRDYDAGYLAEFYWKRKTSFNDRIHQFLLDVAQQFNPYS